MGDYFQETTGSAATAPAVRDGDPVGTIRNEQTEALAKARRKYAAEVEGDSDNPLRVAKANAILRGEHDDEIATPSPAPSDTLDAKAIAASVVQSACETDPADPEHPDTVCIEVADLETIVRAAVENALEALGGSHD